MTATGQARERYTRALAIARDLGVLPGKPAPWKEWAKATCKTATRAKRQRTCRRHSRSTSASARFPQRGACSKPCANMNPHQPTPDPPRYLPFTRLAALAAIFASTMTKARYLRWQRMRTGAADVPLGPATSTKPWPGRNM